MAVGVDDWLVADSEDEGTFTQLPPENGSGASAVVAHPTMAGNLTSVSSPGHLRTPERGRRSLSMLANESLFTPPGGGEDTTTGNFTNTSSISDAPSAALPKPRPWPRAVTKKAAISHHNTNAASVTFSHISDLPISAAERTNDSIFPATVSSLGPSEAIDDLYSSFDIAERAKMRSRKSQTAKKPTHPLYQANEVIELTSDEDELALKPVKRQKRQGNPLPGPPAQRKPRPRPTLKVKSAVTLSNDSPSSRDVIGTPQMPLSQWMSPPQPPASTLPTAPPSAPPHTLEPTPPSSPPVTSRRRKRIRPSIAEDDDEMDVIGGHPAGVSPPSTQPPLFFAPSSSSVPTDSGIEIPPAESFGGRGKKKQVLSGKKKTQMKAQNKGKKGKRVEVTSAADEVAEESTRITQEPSTSATHPSSRFAEEHHSPVVKASITANKTSGEHAVMRKGKVRVTDSCEEEGEPVTPPKSYAPSAGECEGQNSEENLPPDDINPPRRDSSPGHTPTSGLQIRDSSMKPRSTPMSELIRRVNSQPNSPFPIAARTYSPFFKSSRSMLSKIAPLHPNRRTPPPPLPRPPPPKKSKKQLEMEERIEEELAETIDGWSCLMDEERRALRKARIDAELGYDE